MICTKIQMLLCIIFFYITADLLHFIICWFFLKFPCHQFYRLKIQNDTLERALRTVEETSEVRTILFLFSFSLIIFLIFIVFPTHLLLFFIHIIELPFQLICLLRSIFFKRFSFFSRWLHATEILQRMRNF